MNLPLLYQEITVKRRISSRGRRKDQGETGGIWLAEKTEFDFDENIRGIAPADLLGADPLGTTRGDTGTGRGNYIGREGESRG